MSLSIINLYYNNIISTDFEYRYIRPNKYNISYKTYIHPQLIYIYKFLKKKLPEDCVIKIIKYYIKITELSKNKYYINKYLQYYTHCIATYSENNQKYELSCINHNSNTCSTSYSLYKYNLKKYMDNLFDKTIQIILNNYINSKKICSR